MLKGIKDLKNVRANALHYNLASTPQTSSSNTGEISQPAKTTKKTSAFYDDYIQRKSKDFSQKSTSLLSNAIKSSFDGIKKNILKNAEHYSEADKAKTDTAKRKGNDIKSNIRNVLSKKYGELDTRHIFDDVDEKDIEDNISTAESTIKTNIDKGFLSKDFASKLPNLRDGLALSYAAANKGNNKAATKAREAAYMEDEPLVKETGMKLLSNNLSIRDFLSQKNNADVGKQTKPVVTTNNHQLNPVSPQLEKIHNISKNDDITAAHARI